MILSKEHIRLEKQCNNCDCICDFCKDYDAYYNLPEICENDYFDTIEYLYTEMDEKEIAHEKARHDAEIEFKETLDFMNSTVRVLEEERDRLKAHKPCCYTCENTSGWCDYNIGWNDDEPTEACKQCHWCEQGYEGRSRLNE